ncbi:MAG TPA: Fe-S cluster assembly protein SufD [Pseudorhodoplanes sp.]|nr:Fe-S cluster assembly protein SufD [Pseudorhodoplanes sp.]
MNAEIRQIRTAAEQGLLDTYAAAKGKLPGAGEVPALREAAFKVFEQQGLPHRRVEEWKYTDLRAAMRDAKPLAAAPDAPAKARAKDAGQWLAAVGARRIVFVDGVFAPELSDLSALDKGLTIGSLAQALAKADPASMTYLGRASPAKDDPAVTLNTAFMGDGAVIHVADGAQIDKPLHLSFVTSDKPVSIFTRSLVVIGKGAKATLIESFEGPAGIEYQVNHALELSVGEGAQFDHIKIAHEGDKAIHVGTLMADIAGKARIGDFSFTSGGAVVRNQIFMRLSGRDTNANISGASLLKNKQHADNTLVIDHAVPHCTSRETFKSAVDDEARSVFQGKIIVRPDAQKTDGKMRTDALLLSESAEANAKPELEIFADDVVCGHGATAGALDEDLLFYLKARGIPPKQAEALLIQAFIGDAVETIANEAVRDVLMAEAERWLAARG